MDNGPTETTTAVPTASSVSSVARLIGPNATFAHIAANPPGFGGMFYDTDGNLNIYMTPVANRSPQARQQILDNVAEGLRASGRDAPPEQSTIVREGTRDFK